MSSTAAPAAWPSLSLPVLPRLLQFNVLPSLLLHPAQAERLAPPEGLAHPAAQQPGVLAALHRRWSARLLQQLGAAAAPVLDLAEPALPLATAEPGVLHRLARELGIALLGPQLRRVILRGEVLALRQQLGDDGMRWALGGAARLHPGLPDGADWLAHSGDQAADLLGAGLLAQAWSDAPAPLRLRAGWRLTPQAAEAPWRAASGLDPAGARALCLQHLGQTEPTWLSCFPATR